jgi:hypothetical protein
MGIAGDKPRHCMYCNEVLKGGGIHRLKLHLTGEKGEVKQCTHVSAEVRHEMQRSVENFNEKKRKADEDTARVRGGDDREGTPQQVAAATRAIRGKRGNLLHQARQQQTRELTDSFYLEDNQVINKP